MLTEARAKRRATSDGIDGNDETIRLLEEHRSGSLLSLGFVWAGVLLAPGAIITGMVAAGGSEGPGFVFGVNALANAIGIPFGVALTGVVSIEVIVVLFGIELMRQFGAVISIVMTLIIIGLVIGAAGVPAAPMPAGMHGFPIGPFLLASALGFSGSISWSMQASDVSRTLPSATSRHGVLWTVFTSMTLPLLLLGGIGAWISTIAAIDNPMGRVDSLLGGGALAVAALLTMGASLGVANAFNDFSAGLSLVQMGVRLPRPFASLCVTACGVMSAIVARNTPVGELTSDIVLITGY